MVVCERSVCFVTAIVPQVDSLGRTYCSTEYSYLSGHSSPRPRLWLPTCSLSPILFVMQYILIKMRPVPNSHINMFFYNCISFPYFVEGQIQKLKHSVSKGDKKKKKEVTAQCAILEAELDEKHEKELEEIKSAENEVIDFILFSFLSHLHIKQS